MSQFWLDHCNHHWHVGRSNPVNVKYVDLHEAGLNFNRRFLKRFSLRKLLRKCCYDSVLDFFPHEGEKLAARFPLADLFSLSFQL